MSVFLAPLLTFLEAYGYPVLWLTTFVAAIGIPLPLTLVLLAAGAFSAQGDFNVALLAVIAVSAAIPGDCVGYLIGRRWGSRVLVWVPGTRLGRRIMPQEAIERARADFQRHGGWAIFLTRFLLSALGSVTNIIAGAGDYPFGRFLGWDVAGEMVGNVSNLAVGFLVGASWEAAADVLGTVSFFLLALLCLVALGYQLTRSSARRANAREARGQAPSRHLAGQHEE